MADETVSSLLRICTGCGIGKPATTKFFNRRDSGLHQRCKSCRSAVSRAAYQSNVEIRKANSRADYRANKEARSAKAKEWRARNQEKMAQYRQKWRSENRDAERAAYNVAMSVKCASSGEFRMHRAISRALWGVLRGDKAGTKWQEIVGYGDDTLRSHIERQFSRGMTWENYGEWHVDHIVPVSFFLSSGADADIMRRCWALSNLRPLWAKDNLTKHARRVFLL